MLPPILKAVQRLGHKVFDGKTQPAYNLNIVGIRSSNRDQTEDAFDDWMTCTFRETPGGRFKTLWWRCTTDPGKQALLHPELYNADGTAIIVPGQYPSAYRLAPHRSTYICLAQRGPKPITIARDSDRGTTYELRKETFETGFFGCNIHKAGRDSDRISGVTGKGRKWTWSAGCQVLKKERDFNELIDLARLQIETHPRWPQTFTYTLIEDSDLWT